MKFHAKANRKSPRRVTKIKFALRGVNGPNGVHVRRLAEVEWKNGSAIVFFRLRETETERICTAVTEKLGKCVHAMNKDVQLGPNGMSGHNVPGVAEGVAGFVLGNAYSPIRSMRMYSPYSVPEMKKS